MASGFGLLRQKYHFMIFSAREPEAEEAIGLAPLTGAAPDVGHGHSSEPATSKSDQTNSTCSMKTVRECRSEPPRRASSLVRDRLLVRLEPRQHLLAEQR